jgi:hypothetical protein
VKKLILSIVVAGAVVVPATAGAATFGGVVIAKQARRHALIVASSAGVVRTVHTHRLATRVGARVAVRAHRLSDGTFSATKVAVRGRAHKARIHGVVAKRLRGRLLISAGHSLVAVATRQSFSLLDDHGGPKTGDVVDVTVSTDGQELDEEGMDDVGHVQKLELEGTIVSVAAPTSTADGEIVLQVGKSSIDVVVPAGSTLPSLKAGDSVQLEVTLSGTTFTLAKAQSEDDDQGDDDQGDDDGGGGNGDG